MSWEGLWGSTDSSDSFIHSVDVDARGDIILGGSACWYTENCTVEIGGLNQSNLTKSGFILKVNNVGLADWLLPVVSSSGDQTPINELRTNEFGDIAAASRLCVSNNHNSQCIVEIGNSVMTPNYRNSIIIQITQDNDSCLLYTSDAADE